MKEEVVKKIVYTLVLLLAIGMMITALVSCRTTGYGCNGRSKIMTRVR